MMKTLKNYLLMAVALVGMMSFSACDSEEEMERHIIEGYCWEGWMPIYDWGRNEYYSRFFFEPNGTGVEEVYVNGNYWGEYRFTWGWMCDDYAVLSLRYGGRWNVSYSCIDLIDVSHTRLRGFFYQNIDDYYYEREMGFPYSRDDIYFELRSTGDRPHY